MNADGSGKTHDRRVRQLPMISVHVGLPTAANWRIYSHVDDGSFRLFVVDADGSNLTELRIEADAAISAALVSEIDDVSRLR